jgi:hypothetical protein
MAQHIGVAITDSKCRVISELDINFAPIVAEALSKGNLPWVSSVDEYGDTYINLLQAKHLVHELSQMSLPQEERAAADKVVKALTAMRTHTFVAFFGD